jgi:plasmid stability protein
MTTITVRNLDEGVQRRLKRQAAAHDRSMEAEIRAILTAAVTKSEFAQAWIEATKDLRGDDLALPGRSIPRTVDLS